MHTKYSVGDILVDKYTNESYFIFEIITDEPIYYNCIVRNIFEYRFEEGIISSFWLEDNKNIQRVGKDLKRAEQLRSLRDDIKFMLGKHIGMED